MKNKGFELYDRVVGGRIDALGVAEEIAMVRAEFVRAVDGMVCVTALLIAHLEQDGALKTGALSNSLRAVLNASRREATTPEAAVLTAVLSMLSDQEEVI